MKNRCSVPALLLFLFSMLASGSLLAQGEQRASPAQTATGKIGQANIEIKYSSPAVKGRKIWGELVPYGQVWRAGANEATTFKTDKDLMVEGKKLPAGTYAFFAIPAEKEWTIIFNKTANQWGAFKYDKEQDALRVTVMPVKSEKMNERLAYEVTKDGVNLMWENLKVPIKMK